MSVSALVGVLHVHWCLEVLTVDGAMAAASECVSTPAVVSLKLA